MGNERCAALGGGQYGFSLRSIPGKRVSPGTRLNLFLQIGTGDGGVSGDMASEIYVQRIGSGQPERHAAERLQSLYHPLQSRPDASSEGFPERFGLPLRRYPIAIDVLYRRGQHVRLLLRKLPSSHISDRRILPSPQSGSLLQGFGRFPTANPASGVKTALSHR